MPTDAFATIEQLLKGTSAPASVPHGEQKAAFELRFKAELTRLADSGRGPDAWEEENLLSALGAAGVKEFELACAFLEAVHRPSSPQLRRASRRFPASTDMLWQHFKRVQSALA
ncbi:MAG: hypothetical protein JSR91_10180 [Proteobacteria bacterium]|nr:hypothetical protein [Pseudomonadota bacterium]